MRLLIGIAAASIARLVAAQPSAEAMTAEVTDNVATEYAECAAYFAIVQGAFQSSGKATEAAKYKEASDKAAAFSVLAAKRSRSEEMATRITVARFEMSLKSMQKTIDNNYSNMSLLLNQHSDLCVEAMTDSAAIIKRWTEKVSAKYGATAPSKP
jgi:hypothetical protein